MKKIIILFVSLVLFGCDKNKDIDDVVVNINPPKPIIKRFGDKVDIAPSQKFKSFTNTTQGVNVEQQNQQETEQSQQQDLQSNQQDSQGIQVDSLEKELNQEEPQELNFEELQNN